MDVISRWSILETFLAALFVEMLGANPAPAAAIYSSLTSTAAQRDALKAVAATALDSSDADIFEALLSLFSSAGKERNKIAHWVWGHTEALPDAVLLADPRVMMDHRLKLEGWAAYFSSSASQPLFPRDQLLVYRKTDFEGLSSRIDRVMGLFVSARFALGRSTSTSGSRLAQLSAEPEVREFLDRLSERRKKPQAGSVRPPQTSESEAPG